MKRLFLTIAACCIMAATALAQDINYPAKKLIETGQFEKAVETIEKGIQKHPDDCMHYYSLYLVYSNPGYNEYSLYRAYLYLCSSKSNFAKSGNVDKLTKQGVNLKWYDNIIRSVCSKALDDARNDNSVLAYDYFLEKFDQAPDDLRNEAGKARQTVIYNSVKKTNTVAAYKKFVSDYPNSEHAADAWDHIYRMEFDAARQKNTEATWKRYLESYLDSPLYAEAKLEYDKLVMRRSVKPGNWRSYLDFIKEAKPGRDLINVACDSIFSIARRTGDIDAFIFCATNLEGERRNSSLHRIHKLLEDCAIWNFDDFYTAFDTGDDFNDVRAKDEKVKELHDSPNTEEFIAVAAPYYIAYAYLVDLIKPELEARDYQAAAAKMRRFSLDFGADPNYNGLLKVLEAPDDAKVKVLSFPNTVNTPNGGEYAPCVSADGKSFLFCGSNRPDNLGAEDIFITHWDGKNWGPAKLFPDINTRDLSEAPEVLSADNTKLLMYQNGKLFESNKTESGWTKPESMGSVINFAQWQADATFSSDGRVMIYAARAKSPREMNESVNIYVSIKDDSGAWGEPFEIGPAINTPFTDRSPVLHPDMKTLYFCSNGHSSMGDMDVFMSKRLSDDSWTEWSAPVNLGKEINTPATECFYKVSTDGTSAYFSKKTGNADDLYSVTLPESMRPDPVATISGKLVDTDGKPVITTIYWEDLETHEVIGQSRVDPANGSFFIVLPEGKNYGYFIDHKDYFPISNNIDLRGKKEIVRIDKEIRVATIQKMVDEEIPMVLNNLFFNTAEYELLPASQSELDRVIKVIKPLGKKIEISGHTDSRADDNYNQRLSENRANAAREYLIAHGFPADLLVAKGYGETMPIATNDTEEGRQMNRRVEIKFIK